MTLKVFRPMAMSLGIKGGKIMRFTERKRPENVLDELIVTLEQRVMLSSTLVSLALSVS